MKVCVVSPEPVETKFILSDLHAVSEITLSKPMIKTQRVADAVVGVALSGTPAEIKLHYFTGKRKTFG